MTTDTHVGPRFTRADPIPKQHAVRSPVGRIVSWLALAVVLLIILNTLLHNDNIHLSVIGRYLFDWRILEGVLGAIALALVSFVVASVIGIVVGYMRVSRNPVARTASWLYVWFFRSVPLIVFILIFGNFALFLPKLGIGLPFTDLSLWSVSTNSVLVPMVAGGVALSLEQGAYLAEIVRAGTQSVSESQREAAAAMGLSPWQIETKVVLPQAIPVMIPPAGSTFVMLLKSTSLVYAIAGTEVLGVAEQIASQNLATMEMLFVASIWYLVLTSLASLGQRSLERRATAYRRRVRTPEAVIATEGDAGARGA
ncbi:amino acid ABC transporter permease [Amycolatopsis rhabdoformis]|uniref:Amino acid ABC transporter permease n=1 Tax=Amycolatopsis rhabdoformis TaxID=1448059 RepID=A0ABZ1ICU4_9PSEU|nr:amino acid ABC transporter permease [Amycolatopsis rhabdoformis]WSE31369.1 amino acid ABC transporter permease [Amycolatopsis rhabdoformis]